MMKDEAILAFTIIWVVCIGLGVALMGHVSAILALLPFIVATIHGTWTLLRTFPTEAGIANRNRQIFVAGLILVGWAVGTWGLTRMHNRGANRVAGD